VRHFHLLGPKTSESVTRFVPRRFQFEPEKRCSQVEAARGLPACARQGTFCAAPFDTSKPRNTTPIRCFSDLASRWKPSLNVKTSVGPPGTSDRVVTPGRIDSRDDVGLAFEFIGIDRRAVRHVLRDIKIGSESEIHQRLCRAVQMQKATRGSNLLLRTEHEVARKPDYIKLGLFLIRTMGSSCSTSLCQRARSSLSQVLALLIPTSFTVSEELAKHDNGRPLDRLAHVISMGHLPST